MIEVIDNAGIHDPALNLALEEYCFRHLQGGQPFLILYVNDPVVVVGRHQNVWEEADPAYLKNAAVPVLRRISGGGAVYHDAGCLNFSLIRPYDRSAFSQIDATIAPTAVALQALGVDTEINSKYDLLTGGCKISGCAQFTDTRRMMIHATLLFDTDLNALRSALRGSEGRITSKARPSRRSPVTNVAGLLHRPLGISNFTRQILTAFAAVHGGWHRRSLRSDQWDAVRLLAQGKYRSWDWNFGRSPDFRYQRTDRLPWGPTETAVDVSQGCVRRAYLRWPATDGRLAVTLQQRLQGIRFDYTDIRRLLGGLDLSTAAGPVNRDLLAAHLCGC
jgi:lipoate-protein ligase A